MESAKLVDVEPAAFLAEATRRAIATPGTVILPADIPPRVAGSALHPSLGAIVILVQTGHGEVIASMNGPFRRRTLSYRTFASYLSKHRAGLRQLRR